MDSFASALDQAAAVRRREVSSTELTRVYLERIERINPKLNAFVLTTPELALEQAKAADDANIGYPLRGVPTSVKDLVSLAGYPLTFGSRAFEDYTLPIDFYPVARLKEEGCPILGKTNLPSSARGPPRNTVSSAPRTIPGASNIRPAAPAVEPRPLWRRDCARSRTEAMAAAPRAFLRAAAERLVSSRLGVASRPVRCWASIGRACPPTEQ